MPHLSRKLLAALLPVLLAAALAPLALAEHTRHWRQSTLEEFLRGTAHGIAVRSDGRLVLAPRFSPFADADSAYLWALRLDSRGNLYAAGGSNAKVFRFDSAGKAVKVFESDELVAQALAVDAHDNLFVATSPDGKVYKVSPSGEKSVFFEPKTKYIWDLAVSAGGTVYVATGDKGQIFAVAPDGKGQLFYAAEETHIRSLALDSQGNLLAGTEPSGRILRISTAKLPDNKKKGDKDDAASSGPAFVLYETSKKEITALVVDRAGNIFAAAVGEKQRPGVIFPQAPQVPLISQPIITTGPSVTGNVNPGAVIQQQPVFVPFPPAVSSAVYRLAPDGAPEEIWSSRDSLVYALGFSAEGKLLLGTGNDGAIIEVESAGVFSHLAKAGSAQVTGFAQGPSGKIFLSTANPGKVFTLGPDYEAEGSFESQPFDARIFSEWGRLEWWGQGAARTDATKNGDARVSFYVRSGNTSDPGREWSPWAGPYRAPSGEKVECPPARFVQWKAVIRHGRPGDDIDWVNLAYLPRNVAPAIDAIVLQNPGIRIQSPAAPSAGPQMQQPVQLKMPPQPNPPGNISVNISAAQIERAPQKFEVPPQGFQQRGWLSVVWSAHDDNDDELLYSIYYRGEGENEWKLLKDKIEQKHFSWDTTTMPDGAYTLKIVASDAPANPPGDALTSERVSERFEVDNTPPLVEKLSATPFVTRGGSPAVEGVTIRFEARDSSSAIERAEYSLDGGDWTIVYPTGRLSDSPHESYEFTLTNLAASEHTVAVRVFDHFENAASAKTTFRSGSHQTGH